jgi:hypothetical protein
MYGKSFLNRHCPTALFVMNQFILPGMNQDQLPFQVEKISHDD